MGGRGERESERGIDGWTADGAGRREQKEMSEIIPEERVK